MSKSRPTHTNRRPAGRPRRNAGASPQKPIAQYEHADKTRLNNPPVGLVTPETEPEKTEAKDYSYDPHLDPRLVWSGKAEHTSFEVPTVSLHVHERIDARTIIEAVRARNGHLLQPSLFEKLQENPPLREAIDFYKHAHEWSNRLIAGDSLLVMNSLLEKEGMAGQVQMIYIDPPYGIKYGSNFQPFVNEREVRDGKDDDLTQEPETIRAFRDTWELGIHSYLTYLRDRLLLARELLHESGSCFVQISDENLHLVRNLMDEVFGVKNHVVTILVKKKGSQKSSLIDPVNDYVVWFSRSPRSEGGVAFTPLFEERSLDGETLSEFKMVEFADGREFPISDVPDPSGVPRDYRLSPKQLFKDHPGARLFRPWPITNGGHRANQEDPIELNGRSFLPPRGRCWSHTSRTTDGSLPGMARLKIARRLIASGGSLDSKRYLDDFPFKVQGNWWDGLGGATDPIYVVQTNPEIIKRCMLMTTNPGDIVLDPTCGSGTTAIVAEQYGRRWITCDTSRVSITLAKQRLVTAILDYYELAYQSEGVGSGFRYKIAPHVTLASIANNPEIREGLTRQQMDAAITKYADRETLQDQPHVDRSRARVSGPFTVEAVPAPSVLSLEDVEEGPEARPADASVARFGSTLRHSEWRDELLRTGIRGKGGQKIEFSRVEPIGGTRWLHADAETRGAKPERVVISFGPEYAPLEQRQVELAWEEARTLHPKPSMIVFAAFEFDPEAAKDIDELTAEKTKMTFLTAKMNGDLLTEDLKKKRSSNQSFWLIGRPDVELKLIKSGDHKGKWQAEVLGFDYFNTRTGTIESGDTSKIAMWMLDTDYDGRSLYPRQVFFPMAGDTDGWARLARNLKAEIDPELIEAYRGTISLPFEPGKNRRIAVKVVDDRGIESLKIVDIR